jgi:hypothetical protein
VAEFVDGDAPLKYRLTLPSNVAVGYPLRVSLGGKDYTLLIPDFVSPGQTVIAIAPGDDPATRNPLASPSKATSIPVAVPMEGVSREEDRMTASPPKLQSYPSLKIITEIFAIEYRSTDTAAKYQMTLPDDIPAGRIITVNLDGREFNVKLPDNVRPGDSVIIVVPANIPH